MSEDFIDSHDFRTELSRTVGDAFSAEGFDASAGRVNASDRPDLADFQCNGALAVAKQARANPREVATKIAGRLSDDVRLKSFDIAGPGFLNITLETAAQGELARSIVDEGQAYGRSDVLVGQRVNLEFISANPTGPLHLGHTRWA
ncbi:MAG: arginine--tRNA ligase, partial [Asticcacaulis sp.]